jgi:hypothetical protein
VLGTSVILKRYYATYPGHQNFSYIDRKQDYLKIFYGENNLFSNVDVIPIFLQYLGKVWKSIVMSQRPIRARVLSAVSSDPR